MLNRISKTDREFLEEKAAYFAKHSNVNKFGFSPSLITDMFVYLFKKNDGNFNPDKSVCLASDYKEVGTDDYYEVTAVINLMKKYRPKEIIAVKSRKGMKMMIMGDAAEEIFDKLIIRWEKTHITTAVAKIPIELPLNYKLKCFNGERISDEIKRIKKSETKKRN